MASLDFDAESFRAAILNIYPRLSTVQSYSLWNVKSDKSFEKLPGSVNTPKRIKAYLGPTFTGSLVIMPSDEISMVIFLKKDVSVAKNMSEDYIIRAGVIRHLGLSLALEKA